MSVATRPEQRATDQRVGAVKSPWTELTDEALEMLSHPSRTRRIGVPMKSLGGRVIYVSTEQTAQSLLDDDAIIVATSR